MDNMIINKIKRYNKLKEELSILERELYDFYYPTIIKFKKEKNLKELDKLLSNVPDSFNVKMLIYQIKREIKDGIED